MVQLDGGRFATSDFNDLYRRVINRNNRLKRLLDLQAPDIIVNNEKRMLQEAIDALFDNGRRGRAVTGPGNRPLKSLSDMLKGKQGRFRQNLLGKRVDYSGRTVITVGPDLRLHQCGLPKQMALELFKPFVYYRLEQKGMVSTVKSAKKMVEREVPEVWDTLDEVVKEYPVMLNRAPTLHRLGIQAFEPILIEGKAIQLHPLVCTAFNADFDGDQMAVHVPLSVEAQIEARVLMLSSNNILSPANGSPIIVPSQDIVLGTYYMTRGITGRRGEGKSFANTGEVRMAYDAGEVELHSKIKVRMQGKRYDTTVGRVLLWEIIPKVDILELRHLELATREEAEAARDRLQSGEAFTELVQELAQDPEAAGDGSIGKLTYNEFKSVFNCDEADVDLIFGLAVGALSPIIEADGVFHLFDVVVKEPAVPFDAVNNVMDKKVLRQLVDHVYRNLGPKATVILSDRLKDIGYSYSTRGGLSICIDDMIIPPSKGGILKKADEQVSEIGRQYVEGLITQGEKYNKVVDIWAKATDDVANEMMAVMKLAPVTRKDGSPLLDAKGKPVIEESFNPIYMMADSGARGSKDQMRQLAGMRGLMAKPSGEIIETPISANFREGLSVLQYFISTHGARKGLADTALKTANSGYLTRRLADVSQDCVISEVDCGTMAGVELEPLVEGGEIIQVLSDRILGRTALDDIVDPFTEEVIAKAGQAIDERVVERVEQSGLTSAKIRSVLTCRSREGVCSKCYGRDLAHGRPVEIGQAIGILAAQSIGEPGTQLTMRTFHIGGTASRRVEQADIRARLEGTVKFVDLNASKNSEGAFVAMNRRGGKLIIMSDSGRELESFPVIYGAHLTVKAGQKVKAGEQLATWDPFTTPIITEVDGTVKFGDIVPGRTMQEKVDPVTGKSSQMIIESKSAEERPRISIKDKEGKTAKLPVSSGFARYVLPINAILLVEEGDTVKAGDL
ncbi:MAG TPA: DNA-directed RNA polymerase subunit beta', partial [Desulfobacterales bacterium]|nr:DNA-directed RNA polymerase subunit beta' [Desulfobacterales bacterium]